jgi:putative endonuclease
MTQYLFVYILQCADDSLYTGVTNDLDRRMEEHNKGIDDKSYTYYRRPLNLVFSEMFYDPNEAIAFEKQIKRWSKAKKIALIKGDIPLLKNLAECKNETSHKR